MIARVERLLKLLKFTQPKLGDDDFGGRDRCRNGSLVPLPVLATCSQSILHLAEDPCDLRHLFGLVVHNLVSMIDDLRGDRR